MNTKLPVAGGQWPMAAQLGRAARPLDAGGAHGARRPIPAIINRKPVVVNAFTLIELLVVITIMAVLAAFTIPVLSAVKRHQYISQAQAELGQLEAAIDSYHAAYGIYPPDNHQTPPNPLVNQLYYELEGTTNYDSGGDFQVIGSPDDRLSASPLNQVSAAFGVAGFVNCSKFNASEDSRPAQNFLHELKPNQTAAITNNGVGITILVSAVGGPDANYPPKTPGLNPWRYNSSSPTNNPGGYELWMQLSIGGKKYLICNWNKTVQVNNPLP